MGGAQLGIRVEAKVSEFGCSNQALDKNSAVTCTDWRASATQLSPWTSAQPSMNCMTAASSRSKPLEHSYRGKIQ